MAFQGKNIILTGATSGLGENLAQYLSQRGASVFIGGRRQERGQVLASLPGITFHLLDAASEDSNRAFFAAAAAHFGSTGVNHIILNAGVEGNSNQSQIRDLSIANYDYTFGVNVRGVLLGLQYGVSLLQRGGSFAVTSSGLSVLPFAGNPVYAATKAAVDSLVKSFAAQFSTSSDELIKSLSIYSINPVIFVSEMSDRFFTEEQRIAAGKYMNPSGRVGQPEEFSQVLTQLVQEELPYRSGDNVVVDVGPSHFLVGELVARSSIRKQAA